MLVSRKLIEKYIDLHGIRDEELARRLTFAGVEVETFAPLARGTNLVVGEIIEVTKIEGSNHLQKTIVHTGEETLQIVCGGKNARKGLKVIVAKIGAELPELSIRKSSIKGVDSYGMLCSLNELGVSEDFINPQFAEGIEELDPLSPVGATNVFELLGLDDTIFEIRPLANRPDMLAVYNIVRELSALFDRPYQLPTYAISRSFNTKLKLEVLTPLVTSFTLTEVRNVEVGNSPQWLAKELLKHGIRPVNNIVDIGNYVMLLTGRPLHMYDLDAVHNETFKVVSDQNTTFTALDDKEYSLLPGDQLIVDANGVLCLGGIMGSSACSVNLQTKRIAIEVALFDRTNIRLATTRLNLPSEASSRFSKGVNQNNEEEAILLALTLIKEIFPSATFSNSVSYAGKRVELEPIHFNGTTINTLLGTEFSDEEMLDTLNKLGFTLTENGVINVPSYRQEIYGLADLAEEVIRVRGFEHIKTELPKNEETLGELDPTQLARLEVRTLFRRQGFYETLNYTLVNEKDLDIFKVLNQESPLALSHPMTPERAFLRLNILPSLVTTLSYNVSRQQTDLKLFEISNVYSAGEHREHLAFIMTGSETRRGLLDEREFDFYDAKGSVELVLNFLGINENRFEFVENLEFTSDFHPAQSALLKVAGKIVGIVGRVHPLVEKEYNLNTKTFAAELDFKALLNVRTGSNKVKAPAKFPSVSRDLAFVVPQDVLVGDLERSIKQLGGKLVKSVQIFDVYDKLPGLPDVKSVAFTITLSDVEKTLVDVEITSVLTKIIDGLAAKYKAEVRK